MAQQVYSFVLESDPNQVLHLRVSEAWIGPHVEGWDDFHVVSGLVDGEKGAVSFESVNNPGYFLRHANGKLWVQSSDDEHQHTFTYDASFFVRAGLDGHGQSFEATNYAGNFITIVNGRVSLISGRTDEFKRNSSWKTFSHPIPPGGQSGWQFCTKCSCLVYGAYGGHCSVVGGPAHTLTGSYYVACGSPLAQTEQPGWWWCTNCQCMWYTHSGSVCALTGGKHSEERGYPYFVPITTQLPGSEAGWIWCRNCSNLWRKEGGEAFCLHGGKHDPTGGYPYFVYKN